MHSKSLSLALIALLCTTVLADESRSILPDSIVDLTTGEGMRRLRAVWRYSDATVIDVAHRLPGPDLKASGAPNRTFDITPHAGASDFDDAAWTSIAPESLRDRRSSGKLCFNWYRTLVMIPERLEAFDTTGSTVVLEVVLDDYAEIWVNGKLPTVLGQSGGQLVKGWNAPNRVVLTRDARPGERFQLAVFGANGPLSQPPVNFIWVRSATLDFYKAGRAMPHERIKAEIVKLDPGLDSVIASDATVERLAERFAFTEGPVWVPGDHNQVGHLLFSDPNTNTIYRWSEDDGISTFRTKSGYSGIDIGLYTQPGSNGLAIDAEGRLTVCEHGNRRVTRIEKNGVVTVLADRYEGKRLNSPNDLVYRSDGALYFTDPPFGLPKFHDDPRRELPHAGVYCLIDGRLKLVSAELSGPNGLAFSPEERHLYVTNWDVKKKVVMRYDVQYDGSLANGSVFFDMTTAAGEEALNGIKVDLRGNLYISGPGGVCIVAPTGKHLGTIKLPRLPANFAWGDSERRTLFMTARDMLYRVRLGNHGSTPTARAE